MVTHIVLLKLKDKQASAQACKERLDAMVGKVEQIRSLQAGIDFVEGVRSYDVGLVTTFDSLEDLQAYQVHPDHVSVATFLVEASESIVTLDFET